MRKGKGVTTSTLALVLLLSGAIHSQEQEPARRPITKRSNDRVLPGEIIPKPQLISEVLAPLWGRIYPEAGVAPGARVKKGQRLAEIVLELSAVERLPLDDRTLDIDGFLELAKQRMRFALKDYQRALKIRAENPDFEGEVERRKAIYQNALRAFQLAGRQQSIQKGVLKNRDPKRVVVTAPITGYVYKQHFIPGEVNPTDEFTKLYTIVDLSKVWVRVEAYENDLDLFEKNSVVQIHTQAYPNETFKGTLQSLGSEIDSSSRTLPVFYEVVNPNDQLKIGLRVQVRLMASSP